MVERPRDKVSFISHTLYMCGYAFLHYFRRKKFLNFFKKVLPTLQVAYQIKWVHYEKCNRQIKQ